MNTEMIPMHVPRGLAALFSKTPTPFLPDEKAAERGAVVPRRAKKTGARFRYRRSD
jgi:hypothetical protein